MSLGSFKTQAQPIGGQAAPDMKAVFDMTSDAERISFLKSLGAKNADPPLPRSSHLKNKKTGLVLPWNEMLAEQHDVMVNCDCYGNTDPSAWMPTVIDRELTEEERMENLHMQSLVASQGRQLSSGYHDDSFVDPNIPPRVAYPEGSTAFADTDAESVGSKADFDILLKRLEAI